MAQRALYETEIVDMPQVFLPLAMDAKRQTLYEKVQTGKFLLGMVVVTSWERRSVIRHYRK